jgi:DNA polymerase III subunit beta
MKITLLKEKVLEAVLIAERMVGKKEALPVLSCLHFTVGKDLVVRATNLEAGISLSVPGEVGEKGVIAVPASVCVQTLRSVSGDKVTLRGEGGNLLIESKGTRTLIKATPHDDFPQLVPGETRGVTVPRIALMRAVQSVSYAASSSMIRPELGSVYIALRGGNIVAAATDSFRLAEKNIKNPLRTEEKDVLIPLKHAGELVHVLERISDETVSLVVEDSQLTVLSAAGAFMSRVADATFPNYKEVIPKSFTTEAVILKSDFADMLRKARVFSGSDQRVGLHVYPKRKTFSATAQSADVGEMSDALDAALSGGDVDIFFNIAYISECLQSIDADSLTLSFAGPGRPLVVRGVGDASFLYLVMPLNR